METDKNSWFECIGNLHIHSSYSDGSGTLPEILRSARKAGLHFIIFNDHSHMMDDLHLEEEGNYGGVRVLRGLEIGERHHHYLAFDVKQTVDGRGLPPQEVIDQVNSLDGFGFLAHPFEKGMPYKERSVAYTWDDLTVTGYTGLCIWNYMSRWKERIKSPLHGIYCLLFKASSLKGPSRETVAFWDRMCRTRRVAAIGGSDAHGNPFRCGAFLFTPVSYDCLMHSINVHLLLEREISPDFTEAKGQIYEALREGRLFISHDKIASPRGFRFHALLDDGRPLNMGQETRFEGGGLFVRTPLPAEIRLLRNGRVVEIWRGNEGFHTLRQEGVYRVEVYRRSFPFGRLPWIFSNPIYLRN